MARTLTIADLSLKYGLDDEARQALDNIDDVNEMRARAAELRAETLQRELDAAKAGTPAPTTGAGEGEKRAPAGMRQTPEGSGSGSQGAYDPSKFRKSGDIAGALRAQREAGQVKYESIPIRGR